jgi:hypothetical protein
LKKSCFLPNSQNLRIENVLKTEKVVCGASWRNFIFANFVGGTFSTPTGVYPQCMVRRRTARGLKLGRRDSLRKCIRPLSGESLSGHLRPGKRSCTSRLFYLSYGPVPAAGSLGSPSRNHQGARSHPRYLKRSPCWNGRGEPLAPSLLSLPSATPILPPLT